VGLGIAGVLTLGTGCSGPVRPPAAASNEDFSGRGDSPAGLDDRWASIVLDADQRSEVGTILVETAQEPGAVEPLTPAPFGIRFEDIPRAMVNAAPKVEMAILQSEHLDPTIEIDVRDAGGRAAVVRVRCRRRGPLASISYRIPGGDVAVERGEMLQAVNAILLDPLSVPDPATLADPLAHALAEQGATTLGYRIQPERYRYTLLMLDEQEAVIEIRREPAPRIVSWSATAGLFPRPEIADRLGETLMECLRAWGEVPAASAGE
jgi:hypothetical protein